MCGTCYALKFNLYAFRHEWSYIQHSRRPIGYYIYFIDENKRYGRKFRWTMFSVFLRVNVYLATSLRTYVLPYHLTCLIEKAFLLDLNEIIFSFVKKYFVGPCWKALKTIALHTKKTSDSGIKTMPLSS